uniref:Uncharacterized protein n=1 Tax=Romanomermis culicivorax TaxID=13658 RepID=A0A915IBF0_ROMCU
MIVISLVDQSNELTSATANLPHRSPKPADDGTPLRETWSLKKYANTMMRHLRELFSSSDARD